MTEQRSFLKSFVERIDVDDMEVKVYFILYPCPHIMSLRKPWEFYLSYTTVEAEGDKGGEVDKYPLYWLKVR